MKASQAKRTPHFSNLATVVSTAVIAYAAADVVHELVGHALIAALVGVKALSISSVALQTSETSRIVAAAGTTANVFSGVAALVWTARAARFNASQYCLWLFGVVSVMNSGYLIFSAVLESGDWAVVIAGLAPSWAWRLGLAATGGILYAVAISLATRTVAGWVRANGVSIEDVQRLTVSSYVAGGTLLTLASALNPIGLQLVLVSGVGASFGLTWGLLLVPRMVASHTRTQAAGAKALDLQPSWIAAAVLVAVAFVCVLGPGIRLSR